VWIAVGRDPAEGTIIPLYEAPDGLSPAAVRFIRKMHYDDKAFAADLIDMAVKKRIRIEDKKHYTLHRLDGSDGSPNSNDALTADERKVLSELFGSTDKLEIKQDEHETIRSAIDVLKKSLQGAYEKSYFINNKNYFIAGLALTLAVIL